MLARSALFTCLFVNLFVFGSPVDGQQSKYFYRPANNEPHVGFELPSIEDRKRIKLEDFRGKKLLLFHFASW